jgi:hypothetical protein
MRSGATVALLTEIRRTVYRLLVTTRSSKNGRKTHEGATCQNASGNFAPPRYFCVFNATCGPQPVDLF